MFKLKFLTWFLITFFMIAAVLIAGYFFYSNPAPDGGKITEMKIKTPPVPEIDEFGIQSNIYRVTTRRIQRNETLSDILTSLGIDESIIFNLQENFRKSFDFRKIIAGNKYRIYTSADSMELPKYIVYEKDPVNYVVIDLNDTLDVNSGSREISTKQKEVSGVIKYSLYTALQRNEADPELFVKLSHIFAWQIDFYHIQRGDNFKVIYEEQSVDGKVVGVGKILGAYFQHSGEDYYAVDFKIDGREDYFDEKGKSLRKAFLKAPLEYSRISSRFSRRRFHPILKKVKAHLGTDYAAPTGTPIRSVGDGVVIAAAYTRGNGNYVKIRHNSVYTTQYLHMSKFAVAIKKGAPVKQGQVIGYVGSTGLATGPHLCYRFWKNGVQVDPLKQKLPSSNPVQPEYKDEYNRFRDKIISQLSNIEFKDADQQLISGT